MKKILIFYASYGGGHLSAAKSIKNFIDENYTDFDCEMIDCMKYISKPIEKITTEAYREMAKKTPKLWGKVYFDSEKGVVSKFTRDSNKLMAQKLNHLIKEKNPDIIISTHPFSSQMCSYLKKKGKLDCKLATILTDFAIHNQWLIGHEYIDYFFVSNDTMKNDMINYGINAEKIHITGIPMSNRFLETFDKNKIYNYFNLSPNKKTILFFGGGEFGLGKSKTVKMLKIFIENLEDFQIVAIAGKNKTMKSYFEQLVDYTNSSDRVKVLGFTDKVPELMHISEIVVSKPGGLTTTETLSCELPMIIINPIPGQEEENANFLVEKGVAVWIKSLEDTKNIITDVFFNLNNLNTMKENSKNLSKKDSTKKICELLLK